MSKRLDEFGELEPPERDSGDVFMTSFAVVGALVLLEMDKAEAALPASLPPLSIEEAQQLLRGSPAPTAADALGGPAATDAAFQAAIAALTPPWDDMATTLTAPSPGGASHDLAPPETGPLASSTNDAIAADAAIGSSTLPSLSGSSARVVHGDNLAVTLAAGATLTIEGANDVVLTSAGDTIDILTGSSVLVQGDGAQVNLASQDSVSLSGAGFRVRASGEDDVVTLLSNSSAKIVGDGFEAHLEAPGSKVAVFGAADNIDAASDAVVSVGGGGAANDHASTGNTVDFAAGGVVNLMDQSTLAAHGAGAAYLGANDFLALFGAFDVFAPQKTGDSVIAAFGGEDSLRLHSTFADVASLLGASTEFNGATTLHLDSAGDTLTLSGLDKASVSALADSGRIRLY